MAGRTGGSSWLRTPDPLQNPVGSRLAILGAVVLVVGGVAATLAGGTDPASGAPVGSASAASAVPIPGAAPSDAGLSDAGLTANDQPELASWYHGSEGRRIQIATDVAQARGYLAAQDGASLRTVCVTLATDAQSALGDPIPPTADSRTRFTAGAQDYAAAAASCAQLFDGTRVEVGVLQQRISGSLSDGDREWTALAALAGQPMATAAPTSPS